MTSTPKLDEYCAQMSATIKANHELTPCQRAAIVTLVKAGFTQAWVADHFGTSRKAIRNALNNWEKNRSFETAKRSGRPVGSLGRAARGEAQGVEEVELDDEGEAGV